MTTTPDPNAMPDANQDPTATAPPPGPMGWGAPPTEQPPGPMGYSAPPPMRPKKTNWVGIIALVVIVAVIGGAFWLFRDRLSGNAADLAVGDCFDEPAVMESITDVQHQPCSSPHDAEVFAVLTHPAAGGEAYPVVSGFDDYIQQNCISAWEAYTARSWATDTELALSYFAPTLTSWGEGDRGLSCYTTRVDDAKLTGSVRGIGTSPLP